MLLYFVSDLINEIKIEERKLFIYKRTLVDAQNSNKRKTIVHNNNTNYYSVHIIRTHF